MIKLCKAALRKFNKDPTIANLINCKLNRAKACKAIKEAKKDHWQKYFSKLHLTTKPKTVWEIIRKITGEHQCILLRGCISIIRDSTESYLLLQKVFIHEVVVK